MSTANKKARLWVTVIAAILLCVVIGLVIFTQGHVTGTEFSPTHFQTRDFDFYEIPILGLQITPIKRTGTTPQAATFLRQNAYIPTPTGQPENWHLVRISRGLGNTTPADAGMLIDQFSLQQRGDLYWEKWSTDHPAAAKILWPEISKLAVGELYVLIPAMLEQAQNTTDPAALTKFIAEYLPQQYGRLISDLRQAGRVDVAAGLLDEAIADWPDDADLRKLARGDDQVLDP